MNFADLIQKMMEEQEKQSKPEVPDMTPMYEMYNAFIRAGFDEEQAMELLINLSVAVITRGLE